MTHRSCRVRTIGGGQPLGSESVVSGRAQNTMPRPGCWTVAAALFAHPTGSGRADHGEFGEGLARFLGPSQVEAEHQRRWAGSMMFM